MSDSAPRSLAASIVGWVLVAVIAYFLFGWAIGTLRWLLRIVVVVVVIGGLFALYFRLRSSD